MNYEQVFFNIKRGKKSKKNLKDVHLKILKDLKSHKLKCLSIVTDSFEVEKIKKFTKKFKRFENLIFLGTGGSSLGGKTLVSISRNQFLNKKKPNFFFIENVDPDPILELLEMIDVSKTGIIIISKSGETIETLSQYFFVSNFVKKQNVKLENQVLVITEDKDSTLKKIQEDCDYFFLEHDKDIGGRFSVFSSVGLLPAALAGLDIDLIRKGGKSIVDDMINVKNIINFPPALAALNHEKLIELGINQCVLMPYSDKLMNFSLWFRQLWGESIGKNGKGSTPINAVGTVDQHSQLQLYLDGPKDKFITFISTEKSSKVIKLNCKVSKFFNYLNLHKKTLNDLINAEKEATFKTLKKNKIPIRMIETGIIDEMNIGSLLMHFFLETIYTCLLINVNPFDQPAVEEGKKLTIKLLSK